MALKNDLDYFLKRAGDEIEQARHATNSVTAQAHYKMASVYLERVSGGDEAAQASAKLPIKGHIIGH